MITSFGHSVLSAQDAIKMLKDHEVSALIDIRSHPTSIHPHWRFEELEVWVPEQGLEYKWMPELGGWTGRHIRQAEKMKREFGCDITPYFRGIFPKGTVARKLAADGPAWTVGGFWDYAVFMTLPEFAQGARDLIKLGTDRNVAIMCAEFVPWACHRSMVADYLWHYYKTDTLHIQPKPKLHSMWPTRWPRYDPRVVKAMDMNIASLV